MRLSKLMIKETVLYSFEDAGYMLWQHKRGNADM